jgi:hypothetical protein
MRITTAVSAAAAAAAVLSGGTASASTPDWLTVAAVESEHETMLPALCETGDAGPLADTACASLLSGDTANEAKAYGYELPESPAGQGPPALATADLRNFAKWQVCGIAVAASQAPADCDGSIQGPMEPAEPRSGVELVTADTTGAFDWSVCGITVADKAIDC